MILANLKKNRINLDYPTDSFQKFATDNKEILLGRRQAKNDMNFQCNSIGGNVPYNEDSSLAPGEKLTLSSLF